MLLTLSKRSALIAQSEIRAMTLECARIGGINLALGRPPLWGQAFKVANLLRSEVRGFELIGTICKIN
jgi:hypothetical protein